jgi:hypothetical protein
MISGKTQKVATLASMTTILIVRPFVSDQRYFFEERLDGFVCRFVIRSCLLSFD